MDCRSTSFAFSTFNFFLKRSFEILELTSSLSNSFASLVFELSKVAASKLARFSRA